MEAIRAPVDREALLRAAKVTLYMLWEPWSGSPITLAKTIREITRIHSEGGSLDQLAQRYKDDLHLGLKGNFLNEVRRLTIPEAKRILKGPDSIYLDEDQRRVGETMLTEAQLNGLLINMDLCLWGVRAIVDHCVRRGVDAEKLWNWAPDQDSEWGRDIALPAWKVALPEHLQDGKLPTLKWVHDAIETTLKEYRIERFHTLQLLQKGDLPKPREL